MCCFAYSLLIIINGKTRKIYIHYSFDLLQTRFRLVAVSLRQTWQQGCAGTQCCRQPAETHLPRDPSNKPHKLVSKMFLDRTRTKDIFMCQFVLSEWTLIRNLKHNKSFRKQVFPGTNTDNQTHKNPEKMHSKKPKKLIPRQSDYS